MISDYVYHFENCTSLQWLKLGRVRDSVFYSIAETCKDLRAIELSGSIFVESWDVLTCDVVKI